MRCLGVMLFGVVALASNIPSVPYEIQIDRLRAPACIPQTPSLITFAVPDLGAAVEGEKLVQVSVVLRNGIDGSILWQSGNVSTTIPVIEYGGSSISAGTVVKASVRVQIGSSWSSWGDSVQEWVVGIDSNNRTGVPIWPSSGSTLGFVRKTFTVSSSFLRAFAFVSGESSGTHEPGQILGASKLFVEDEWLTMGPGRGDGGWKGTSNPTSVPWAVHPADFANITDLVVASMKANGGNVTIGVNGYGGPLWCEVWLIRESGIEVWGTDSSWIGLDGSDIINASSTLASPYGQHQEHPNGPLFPAHWSSSSFSVETYNADPHTPKWGPVKPSSSFYKYPLQSKRTRSLAISTLAPVPRVSTGSNSFFMALPHEIVGGWTVRVPNTCKLSNTQSIHIRLSEELGTEPNTILFPMRTGNKYESYVTVGQQVGVPCTDGMNVSLHSRAVFRYLTVDFPTGLDFDLDFWQVLYPWNNDDSSFSSSNDDLNQIIELCNRTLQVTATDTSVDSPTREDGLYSTDAYIAMVGRYDLQRESGWNLHSATLNIVNPSWPTEWLQITALNALADAIESGGSLEIYERFKWVLANSTMRGYMSDKTHLVDWQGQPSRPFRDIVDWPSDDRDGYVFTAVNTVVNAYAVGSLRCLAALASEAGDTSLASKLSSQADATASSMLSLLVENGLFCDGLCSNGSASHHSIHASAFPLWHGVVPYGHPVEASAASFVVNNTLSTMSVYGAFAYLGALRRAAGTPAANYGEAALQAIVSRTTANNHTWAHMLDEGATLTWEAWTRSEKPNLSMSHAWATAPITHAIQGILGLTKSLTTLDQVEIAPQLGNGSTLTYAQGRLQAIQGPIDIYTTRASNNATLKLSLPPTLGATACLPLLGSSSSTLLINGKSVSGSVDQTRGRICTSSPVYGSLSIARVA